MFNPFIDNFIIELKTRFDDGFKEIIPLANLILANKDAYNYEELLNASLMYIKDLPANSDTELKIELELCKLEWLKTDIAEPKLKTL